MSRRFSPQERLGDFLLNREASATTVETLRNFLCTYEPTYRKKIINAKLSRFHNRTSVHLAAEKGLAPFLRILLKHGGNPNAESSLSDLLQTPLHLAAKGGFWQCMELLLEYGAKLNVEDMHRKTPCDHIRGRPKCNLVVTHHIAKCTIPQRNQSEEDKVQSLHTMMADEDSTEIFKLTYARLNTYQQDLATRWLDLRNNTLLYRACYYNRQEVVKFMLQLSEHMPLANLSRGDTPLHCVSKNQDTQLAEILLDHSPQLALVRDTIMDKRYTPLHIACMEQGNEQMIKLILQKILLLLGTDEYSEDSPLDMNIRDADGCTPLYYACYYGHDEIVSMLLKFGHQNKNCQPCDVSITTLQKRTPLHAAVQRNHLSTLQIILDHYTSLKYDSSVDELINMVGRPSSDTKSHLLGDLSLARSSVASICNIISQDSHKDNESSDNVFTTISEENENQTEELISQKFQNGNTYSLRSKLATTHSVEITTQPVRVKALSVKSTSALAFTQQPVPSKRRSKTERSTSSTPSDQISLFLTRDGSFLAHPTKHHLENINKEFDQLLITPLAEACACGHSQAVDMLLSAGATDPEGMAVRLAQFAKNHELAHSVLIHHCKLVVENPSQQPFYALSIDWSGMKIIGLASSWFVRESNFFPSSAEDDDGNFLPMTSLPTQLDAYRLTKVSLSRNNLTSLPVELLQLPNLQSLDVSSNLIQNIPSKISCPALKYLYLSYNKLIELPIAIWYLPNLEELQVSNNFLQSVEKNSIDSIRLSRLLKIVNISYNKLDALPSFVLELPTLEELNVSYNELSALPHNLWECSTLRELNASHNALVLLPFCNPQSTLMTSHQPSHAIPAVQCGRKVVGAKAHVQGNFEGLTSKFSNKSSATGFVSALETPQEIYSEEYMYHNEGCCGVKKMLLGKNELSVFPDALPCLAPLLIELDISHNSIEEIDISFLPLMLRKLVASHNQIKRFGTFINPQLKSHMIRYCRMVGAQDQECRHRTHRDMKNLTIIDLAYNQLRHFQLMQWLELDTSSMRINQSETVSIQSYSQLDLLYPELENLNVSNNRLEGCFNHNIGYQSQLKSVTLGGNVDLEELPMEFAYFKKRKTFTQLSLNNLPKLRDPPVEYHDRLRPLLSYMSSRLKNSVNYYYIKLIVVGCGERGKTTLLRRLRGLSYDNLDRTVGIDIEPWTYGQPPVTFITWDFAGQDIYNTTHQCFYSRRSLYLALYRLSDKGGVTELDSWLRNIKLRAPDSPVIVIGTHLDQVTDSVAKESEARVRQYYSNTALYPTIVDVCSVSCVKKGYFKKVIRSTVDQLRSTIYQVATHLRVAPDGLKLTYDEKMPQTDPEALFHQKIPQVYLELQEKIQTVVVNMKKIEKPPVMRSDEFRNKFLNIMDDEEELSDAVQYLHHQGTLLHFTDQALKNVYFLDPQWLCKMMASVIRVPPAGKESLVKNGSVDINDLFTESKALQAFKDECINLLSKFDIALRLKNRQLLVPSLLPVDPPTSLPSCTNDSVELMNDTHSDISENVVDSPLWKFWFSKFIPNGFWPRLICRLTTSQIINAILKFLFPVLLDDCSSYSSKDDMFLPWTLWRSGLALTCKDTLLVEVKEVLNNPEMKKDSKASVKDSQFRVEACVNIPGWVVVIEQLNLHDNIADQDIVGRATSIMVEIVKHISSLATDWFPGMFIGYFIEGQVPCYVPCWKCCFQHSYDVISHYPCLEQNIAAFSIERDGHIVHCWELDSIIIPAVKGKPIWCDVHSSIDPRQLTPELFFRDLGDYANNNQQSLWIDKDRELGKGGFGVVLKGELGNQENDKIPVAVKVLLPEADSKLKQSTLEQVLKSASADHLMPQSYHDVRQEVSILSKLHHDNLAKLCGVRITPIIPGTTPMICLLLELASKSSLRDVLKKYKAANVLMEPSTLTVTIRQIASGLDYLHQHQIAHLDIKSSNVLVWEFPLQLYNHQDRLEHATEVLVKIADYGTSRISTLHGIKSSNPTGTPGYMAPELFSHQGQEISPDKVDVFAFGMTIYELITMKPPYNEFPRKNPANLHKYVRDGRRPSLTDKEAQSPVLIQEMMQMCWEHEPNNRPSMLQVLQWAESIEFDSLRVDSNLAQVTAISTACVSRIDPAFDSYCNSDDTNYEFLVSRNITHTSSVSVDCNPVTNDESTIQPRPGKDGMGEVHHRVGLTSEVHLLAQDSKHVTVSACTQTWLCGRDKRKGLVTIFTYEDNKPGYSLFYGYACEQEITAICAVYNHMWLGSVNGELRVIHAPTMKTKFVSSLNSIDHPIPGCILEIVHVKADRRVIVSTRNCDVWIFMDIPDKGGLRLTSHLRFSDEYQVFHMTVVDVNGSPEVWGTCSENKILVFLPHQSNWGYSKLRCEPFSGGRLLMVALATSSIFTGKHGDSRSHVWVSFNRRAYIVCWDAVKKKQLHMVDCKKDMQIDEQGLQVSALLASGQFVYAGTTVGVIGVWSSEDATLLQVFHYHEHKVRMLLEMPLQVSPCVCPEVPSPKDRNDDNMNNVNHLITSIGNGRKKLLLHPNINGQGNIKQLQRHEDDICLLTWQSWK